MILVDHATTEEHMKEELQIIGDQLLEMVSGHRKKIKEKDYY